MANLANVINSPLFNRFLEKERSKHEEDDDWELVFVQMADFVVDLAISWLDRSFVMKNIVFACLIDWLIDWLIEINWD